MAGKLLIPGSEHFPLCRVTQWGESWVQPQSPMSGPVGRGQEGETQLLPLENPGVMPSITY